MGGHQKPLNLDSNGSFSLQSNSWTLHLVPTSKGISARLNEVLLQSVVRKKKIEVYRLMIDGQETAKDLDSGIFIACSWVLASHS